ncbi:BgTH12-02155 [Blumeria graminis f. sp. triticale]|uniref:BgTH12-02155 n=1 Tax=Blumeria graminis f. sp. triticale TaxID=1689686 RepID=A0A9W4CZR8_BLUGR|nr:BgTH12-02155 [Blumeria graminis f. sp. triticale]
MKFFSPALNATLAGLLQLVIAEKRIPHYICNCGQIFKLSLVRDIASNISFELSRTIVPPVPEPQNRESYAFEFENKKLGLHRYLVQQSGILQATSFFELVGTNWEECDFNIY